MNACFLRVLNLSITAGWLVSAVVLLRFALKKAPKWVRCLLWGIVALRLLLPFTIESSLSLLPSAEPVRTESVTVEPGTILQKVPDSYQRVVFHSGFEAVDEAVNPVMAKTAEETMAKTGTDAIATVETAAAWIWAAGAAAMLLYAAASYLYMRHKVRVSIRTERNVYVCDDVHSPFILGTIRPKIYLPSGLDAQSRAYILAHERAHIRRLDHLWKPLGFLLLSIHWFNPLIWIAFLLLSRDIEFACDEKVISQLDAEGKAAYSDTLLAFSRPHRTIAVCPVAFGEVNVKKRVRSVLYYRKSALWIVLVAVCSAAAVAVCFLTAPKPASAEAAASASTRTAAVSTEPSLALPKRLTQKRAGQEEAPEEEPERFYLNPAISASQLCDEAE